MGYKELVSRCTTSTGHQLLYTEKSQRLHLFYIHVVYADNVIRMTSSAYNKSQGSMLSTSIITMENRLDRFFVKFHLKTSDVSNTRSKKRKGEGWEGRRGGGEEGEIERWICAYNKNTKR